MKVFLLNIIKFGIILALFTPFIFSQSFYFPYVGPKGLYFMGLAEIVFFTWLILAIKFPQYRPRSNPLTVAFSVFLLILALSSLLGVNLSLSFWSKFERMSGVLMWLHIFAFYLAVSSVLEIKDWKKIFHASIGLAAIMAIIAFFQHDPKTRGGGLIGNDSFLGTYLLFNLFIALWLLFGSRVGKELKIKNACYSAVCFSIMAWSLISSNANAAKISFLGGLALLVLLSLSFARKKFLKTNAIIVFALLFLMSFFVLFSSTAKNKVYDLMVKKFGETTIYSRLVVWDLSKKAFLEKPLLGWGPENFEVPFAKYYDPCFGDNIGKCGTDLWFDRAHNVVFDNLVAAGLFGLLSYLSIFFAALYLVWKKFFEEKTSLAAPIIFTSLFAAYFFQNLTVFDMPNSYLMLALCFGFISFLESNPKKEKEKPVCINSFFDWAIVFIFIISFFNFVVGPYKTDKFVVSAASSPLGSVQRLTYYQKTFEASPMGKFQIRLFFAQNFLNALKDEKTNISEEESQKEFQYLAQELEKSIRVSPFDFKSHLVLGQLYNNWVLFDLSKTEDAQRVLEKAVELSPTNQQAYWNLAQTRIYQQRYDEAISLAQKAFDLDTDYSQSLQILEEIKKIKVEAE